MGRNCLLADSLSRDVVSIKTLVGGTIKHNLKLSEMLNHRIEDNNVNETGTLQGESVVPGRYGVLDLAPAGHHQATGQTNQRMKWETK